MWWRWWWHGDGGRGWDSLCTVGSFRSAIVKLVMVVVVVVVVLVVKVVVVVVWLRAVMVIVVLVVEVVVKRRATTYIFNSIINIKPINTIKRTNR